MDTVQTIRQQVEERVIAARQKSRLKESERDRKIREADEWMAAHYDGLDEEKKITALERYDRLVKGTNENK